MARLYSNENVAAELVLALRELGHDVLTSLQAGNANQGIEDQEVVAFAAQQSRSVLTMNRLHFIRLHRNGIRHNGILVCTFDPEPSSQAQRIHEALQSPDANGRFLCRINLEGHRFD